MSSPAVYRIRVRGELNACHVRQFEGLNITTDASPSERPDSIVIGRFIDQAALSGILNALYEFHLPLVSIDCLDVEPT